MQGQLQVPKVAGELLEALVLDALLNPRLPRLQRPARGGKVQLAERLHPVEQRCLAVKHFRLQRSKTEIYRAPADAKRRGGKHPKTVLGPVTLHTDEVRDTKSLSA